MDEAWEYSSFFVATAAMREQSLFTVVQLNGQPWDFMNNPKSATEMLNLMGAEGWELVAVFPLGKTEQMNPQEMGLTFYLKRRRR